VNEEILEAIETKDRKVLYITSNRLIIAKLGGQALSMAFGVFGALAESRMRAKKKEQLSKLSPESVLTANKKNFAIPYTDVTKVEMSKGFLGQKITITVGAKKHKFAPSKRKEFDDYVNVLQPLLGDKLTVS